MLFALTASPCLRMWSHDSLACRYHRILAAHDKQGCGTSGGTKEVSGTHGEMSWDSCASDDKQTQNEERSASSLRRAHLGERLPIYSAASGLVAAACLNPEEALSAPCR